MVQLISSVVVAILISDYRAVFRAVDPYQSGVALDDYHNHNLGQRLCLSDYLGMVVY